MSPTLSGAYADFEHEINFSDDGLSHNYFLFLVQVAGFRRIDESRCRGHGVRIKH